MELFGKEIKLKTHNCSFFNQEPTPKEAESIALYTKFKGCNASCNFCEYMDDASHFNLEKYKEILLYLKNNIWLDKINLTGGEPTLNWKLFNNVLNLIREIFPDIYVVLNTNGHNLKRIFDENINQKISNISLSRHHYDDEINEQILKLKAPTTEEINFYNSISPEETFHVTCNLIKGYIDNKEEAIKYLNWAAKIKMYTASFVSLMPINQYCKDNFVHFNELILRDNLFLTQQWEYENKCACFNWIYIPKDDPESIIRVYTKNTYNPMDITTSLMYDGQNLKIGFSEKIIA